MNYYYVFFYGSDHNENGMVKPFNSYVFIPEVNTKAGCTEVEVYAASLDTKVPVYLIKYVSKHTKIEDVCEDVFQELANLSQNKGLKARRFF